MLCGKLWRQSPEQAVHALPQAVSRHRSPSVVASGTIEPNLPLPADTAASILNNGRSMNWPHLAAICLFCWFAVALTVGTIVGHSIALSTSSDPD
jgi:hypothetical protein